MIGHLYNLKHNLYKYFIAVPVVSGMHGVLKFSPTT